MEIWKDVEEFEGLYQISNYGRVKSLYKKIIMKTRINRYGYEQISLTKNQQKHTREVHRLVALNFLYRKRKNLEVNHIDGNKMNNNSKNLEWVTKSENVKHAWDIGLKKKKYGKDNPMFHRRGVLNHKSRKVNQYDKDGNFIKSWDYMSLASKLLNINLSSICSCCRKNLKTAGGYKWEYADD